MLPIPFYLTAIFTQVYHLYGTNSSITITSGETYIQLAWPVTDINANYFVLYGVSGSNSEFQNETITMPTSNDTDVTSKIFGLDPGEQYTLEIHKDGVMIFKDFIATRPLPVQNIELFDITATTAKVTWSPDPGSIQDKYTVFVTGISNASFHFQSVNRTEPDMNITDLQPGQKYNVSIIAFSHGEPSNFSTAIEFNTAPLPPLTVTVDAIDKRKLNVTWQPDTTTAQDSYRIGYTYNNSAGNEVEVNITCQHLSSSYCEVDMPGIPGQLYQVRVFSVLGDVLSVGTETVHSTIPLPVSNLQEVQANDSALHIRWTKPDLTLTYFEKFIIIATSIIDTETWDIAGDQNEMIIMDLRAGTFYNVSVVTSTGYETSSIEEQQFYTYPKQAVNLSNNEVLETTNSSLTVHWAITDNHFSSFIINIIPKPENATVTFPLELPPTFFSYTFTDLMAGQPYVVSLITKLANKQTDPVTQTFTTVPNKPENLTQSFVNSNQISVQWSAPSGHVDKYRLTLTQGASIVTILTIDGTDHSFIDLQPGTPYSVDVESKSGNLFSEAVNLKVTTKPASVGSLYITLVDSYKIEVVWTRPQDSSNIDRYQLTIDPADVTSPVSLPTSFTRNTFHPLKPGQMYTISISTTMAGIPSEAVTKRAITKPLPVESLQAVAVNSSTISLTWSLNTSSQQSHFLVTYQELPSSITHEVEPVAALETKTSYQVDVTGLFPGGEYKLMVTAWQNKSGEYAVSQPAEVTGTTNPKPVVNLTATLEDKVTIHLDWLAAEESIHDHYVVEHRASLRDSNALWVVNSTLSTNLTLPNLFPGERYEMQVYAVKNDAKSEKQNTSQVTEPLAPASVQVLTENATTSTVVIQWIYNHTLTFVESWIVSYTLVNGSIAKQMVPRPDGDSSVVAVIDELVAGYHYEFSLKSVVLDMSSDIVEVNATTKPFINTTLTETGSTTSSIQLSYTEAEDDFFDKFVFHLLSPEKIIEKEKGDSNKVVTFIGLEAGALYQVEVETVSGEQRSTKMVIEIVSLPNLAIVNSIAKSHDITLTLKRPTGGIATYNVVCRNPTGAVVKDVMVAATEQDQTVLVDGLTPHTEYTCEVKSQVSTKSNSLTLKIMTLQAAPSKVLELNAIESAPNEVTLSWKMPAVHNGEIMNYIVNYIGRKELFTIEGGRNVSFVPEASIVFDDLLAGYTYTFYVKAITVEEGASSSVTITLRTYQPPYRDGIDDLKATPKMADTQSVPATPYKLYFNFTNAFSDKYGEIIQYTVIVTEDPTSKDIKDNTILPGWKIARNDPAVKAYQVISNCSDFFSPDSTCDSRFMLYEDGVDSYDYKVFEIGTETDCESRYYCNGPLKPDTAYYIALRAFTLGGYKDTPFSEAVRTTRLPVPEEPSNVGAIVGAVLGILVVIVLVIVVFFFVRRRMAKKSTMYRQSEPQHLSMKRTKTTSCLLSDFKDYVRQMAADSDFKYAEQFEELKDVGRNQPCTAAELPGNRGKNRFTNILPYDHSRVKLLPVDDEEGSDYINANYIMGFNSKREYIVTQGPLPSTRDDFWRMLWEQNCRNIVMLTKCMEKGREYAQSVKQFRSRSGLRFIRPGLGPDSLQRSAEDTSRKGEKCDHYWPNSSDALFYGDIQVAILNETVFPDWTITEFKVCLGDQTRQVRHFHFTAWPDFGVPKKPQSLVRFVRTVRAKLFKDGGPILTHCSAGVGRSGTFVVLDTLLQRIKTQDTVDIFGAVSELRKDRVWMVQTEQQYICIHQCLLCVLDGTEDEHIYDNVAPANVNIAFEDDEGVAMT